jgi:hypothetical protein
MSDRPAFTTALIIGAALLFAGDTPGVVAKPATPVWQEYFVIYNRGYRKHWIGVTGYPTEAKARETTEGWRARPVGLVQLDYADNKKPCGALFIRW